MNPTKEEQLEKARALMNKHGLHDWRVSFADLSHVPSRNLVGASFGVSGLCNFREKHIVVDLGATKHSFLQIVKHEIGHALVGLPGHGASWLVAAKKAGCSKKHLDFYRISQ